MSKDISLYYTWNKSLWNKLSFDVKYVLCAEELTRFEMMNFNLVNFSVRKFYFSCKHPPLFIHDIFNTIRVGFTWQVKVLYRKFIGWSRAKQWLFLSKDSKVWQEKLKSYYYWRLSRKSYLPKPLNSLLVSKAIYETLPSVLSLQFKNLYQM